MTSFRRTSAIFQQLGPLLALAVLIAGTALVERFTTEPGSRVFLTPRNFANILGQWSYVGIVAVGMTFVIIRGCIDLSVGSMVALAAGTSIYAMNAAADATSSPVAGFAAACIVCILGGAVLGAINGVIISKGRIASFVATLGTLAMYRSLITAPAEGSEIRSEVSLFGDFGSLTIGIPGLGAEGADLQVRFSIFVFIAIAIFGHLLLSRTVFGRRVYAAGDNATAARYSGVNVDRITLTVFTISGFCCGLSALLNGARLNSVASSSLGLFYELDAIAAVVIGGTRLEGGAGRMYGTVIGVLIMGVISNMLTMLDVSSFYHGLVKGLVIIAAVLMQRARKM